MLRRERLERMDDHVRQHKYVSINELVALFNISRATARRDVALLLQYPGMKATRGGVVYEDIGLELPFNEKRCVNQEEKARIAQSAAKHILPGMTIAIDTGTTAYELVPYIKAMAPLHVVTHDILIATELATANPLLDITVVGGRLRHGYYTLRGHWAESFWAQLRVDLAFLSLDTVDVHDGCMITNEDEVTIKRNIIQAANQTLVLCDHDKFGKKSFLKVCDIAAVDGFITGRELAPQIAEALTHSGTNLWLV